MRITTALVDLDGICYRAAFATQKTTRHVTIDGENDARASFSSAKEMDEWLEENELTRDDITIELEVVAEPAGHAIYVLKHMLRDIEYYTGSHVSELFLTGEDNFRDMLYDQYKANRKGKPKPINLAALREYAIDKMGAELVNGMEADDAISIRATELEEKGEDYFIVSQDKDLWSVPGWHYNFVTQEQELVDPATASFNFYVQLLTGDSTDNIPGIYRIGKVRAENILADCLEDIDFYNTCKAIYEEKGIPEDEMIRNARLLWMLRHDKDLWEPPID